MKNRSIYLKDPTTRKLVNEGVASVNDNRSSHALEVLRYELETFVCDGQYEKGMFHILETYLKNLSQAQQPAVWVSGFYGSGKSHLVKMLRALWEDTKFDDNATARGIARTPENISALLKELSIQGKRHGGLHAASGTLGAGASGSVRLALLRIVFKSADLPEQYPQAKFSMWLRSEGLFDSVKRKVESDGVSWNDEIDDFYVSESIHAALCELKPNLFPSLDVCLQTLVNLFPNVPDVSSEQMLKDLEQALKKDGKLPLTIVVLDEIQQYIGDDAQRSMDVQEAVEACCKNIGSKLLFIGTGQTAVTGTANLKRLEGRFTVRVELSDADVDSVIRQVILAKDPSAKASIDSVIQSNLGEVSRHLSGTSIGHRQEDLRFFAQDYPILPVRRRFWELTFRVLDQTGTDSQLRNQLSMIHKVIQTNIDSPLGNVVPADYLYFDSADKLQQSRVLPRKIYQKTTEWFHRGSDDERLLARACGLIFLVNKIIAVNKETGIKATSDTIADLLVEDLSQGSSSVRSRLPDLLNRCDLVMKVGDEYRIQTEESSAWNDDFLKEKNILANESHRVDSERDDRIRSKFAEISKKISITHGDAAVPRDIYLTFDAKLPDDASKNIYIWVRTGWSTDENSVKADARQFGVQSPSVFVFIPKRSADDLRRYIIDYKSAEATLLARGEPSSPEGKDARAAMETTRSNALDKIQELLGEAFSGARVFQGGGQEVVAESLQVALTDATKASLQRLYPNFPVADHKDWGKVYEKAQKGAPDALKAIGYDGEPATNPVCKAILSQIGAGKKGADIRAHFESAPNGWPRDAVDGSLHVLLVAGLIKAINEQGRQVDGKEVERKYLAKTTFKVESTTISPKQRIEIRKLLQKFSIQNKTGEEIAAIPQFLGKISELIQRAGGEAPKPSLPICTALTEAQQTSGNEQMLVLVNHKDELTGQIEQWTVAAEKIEARWKNWQTLTSLVAHAEKLENSEVVKTQVQAIRDGRLLLAEPDPVSSLISVVTQSLREELNRIERDYDVQYERGMQALQSDSNWVQLEPEQKNEILRDLHLLPASKPKISVKNVEDILGTLSQASLSSIADRVAALSSRFNEAQLRAAELMEPQAVFIEIQKKTLKSNEDLSAWLEETKISIQEALSKGPVVIR